MPESYFGNLIQAVCTGTAARLLLGNPPEFGADVIKKAIEAHDAKEIDRRNKEWEEKLIIFQDKDAGMNFVAVGSSSRFKVYDVDSRFMSGELHNQRSRVTCHCLYLGLCYGIESLRMCLKKKLKLRSKLLKGTSPYHALKGIWVNFAKDQLFCLLGPNGAGKTTFINCLTGIIPVTVQKRRFLAKN